MAAPTITARQNPIAGSKRMPDGFPTTVAFSLYPNINFWERDVKPPGIDGGEPIDVSTMLNTLWHTMRPRTLLKVPPMNLVALYDPDVYAKILSHLINKEGSVTIHFPDNSTVAFYGYLQKFEPSDVKEGDPPTAAVTIVCTNYDPVNNIEVGPLVTPAVGT